MRTPETAGRPKLEARRVDYAYASAPEPAVFSGLDLRVAAGEFLCVLGPSGCGKSTLLHLLAGLLRPRSGEILFDGVPAQGPGRDRGVLFQEDTLLPWKTVEGNVAFGARGDAAQARAAASLWLRETGLEGAALKYPRQLSPGMRQRAVLARALASDPEVLLADEPFGALDALTRAGMQELLLSIWQRRRRTVVFVTHDVDEALLLADRIVVLGASPAVATAEFRIEEPHPRPDAPGAARHAVRAEILASLGARRRRPPEIC